ncbi:Holliday junction resolvase RuvX [Thiopseudomonas acetoxidans]|uniref:Putative pre-16S rRNA nuclease n=1 Tax=Thiopseudomonas acetoxidans TaxID=3041622 RepID=A0ABT7SKI1_9GAMM|nr:Holliday junction resolvase RuvX [Thiopseudomonas sp. CY1220]MDM7856687.1 Holliday junction resolvase RuvX [Thiopseudomonas sp. CY1220]
MPETLKSFKLLLGFDYGTKQIGVAVGQALTQQARPLTTLKARDGIPNWEEIAALIKEWQPDALVIGLPLNMDGTTNAMCTRAQKFSRRLNGRFNLPVYTHDERLTTYAAKGEQMRTHGTQTNYRENPVDALAATLLLQGWLEQNLN